MLASSRRGQIVVLARTTNLLRTVALACADLGVKHQRPGSGVRTARRTPGARSAPGLLRRADQRDRRGRRAGLPRPQPRAALRDRGTRRGAPARRLQLHREPRGPARQRTPADQARHRRAGAGRARRHDRRAPVHRLPARRRRPGRLLRQSTRRRSATPSRSRSRCSTRPQAEAAGKTVTEYRALLAARTEALLAIRDDEHGIELTTIHRAKGRQWPRVELFACEESQLPHQRALDVTDRAASRRRRPGSRTPARLRRLHPRARAADDHAADERREPIPQRSGPVTGPALPANGTPARGVDHLRR